MERRDFLRNTIGAAGGAAVFGSITAPVPAGAGVLADSVRVVKTVTTSQAGGLYTPNRSPLRATPFLRLPPGSITPKGWIRHQLDLQVNGLNGRMPEVSDYLRYETCGWVDPAKNAWEELPYWLRGFGDLGYVTGDQRVLNLTRRWVDGIIATQQPDGWFGPRALRTSLEGGPDFWPHMPLLNVLRSFQEYTGDSRVIPFMTGYFRFQNGQPPVVFSRSWAALRWGDNIDSVFWLYNRTGEAWLLDLVRKIHAGSADYTGGIPNWHNVNLAQGFREPAEFGLLAGEARFRDATYRNYDTIMRSYGQFSGGGFAGDENVRTGHDDPRQGFETCGIVEFMHSHQMLTHITGDPVWADRCEELAFNSLPAALDPAQKGVLYIVTANGVQLDRRAKTRGQFQNDWGMQAYMPGVHNYRCCPHNYGMGWPYYAEELWLATFDNGLCASMYGPSSVRARVGNGTNVTIEQSTGYPFDETISLRVTTPSPVAFPLYLRVPGWSGAVSLQVNGAAVPVQAAPPCYIVLERTWNTGDTVTLRLPMRAAVRVWTANHGSLSLNHGPLAFSLDIGEDWRRFAGTGDWPEYEVFPLSAWNYGLVLPATDPASAVTVQRTPGAPAGNPFTHETAPIRLRVQARRIPNWKTDDEGVVTPLQDSPVRSAEPVETVTLIPMGAARLRITSFPRIGDGHDWQPEGVWFRIQNRNSGKVLGVDQMSTADSARVVQYADSGTADHLWMLVPDADGYFRVRNRNSGKVLGVDQMSTADGARVVQYADNGTADHLWQPVDTGDGHLKLRNRNSGKILGVDGMSTADSAQVIQHADNGTPDLLWRLVPDGQVKILNRNSGKVLGVDGMSTADSAQVVQYRDSGTADHLWTFVPDTGGYFRIRNHNSGKVLGVDQMSTADSARVVQYADNGTADHLWRLRYDAGEYFRVQNKNSGKVLGVDQMSTADSARVVQYADNGTADHLWRFA
ncbi:RICIN domain-containing protein [Streptosporangium sp. G11]|uniref:RICIN domain-containing protein n=1 Tax=Streptosporangium sp. G11 TaxID=3436926 RepID=UPI003EBE61A7